ncbi:zinc finger, CCHC-type containing protein, partial [Tanacetum coccineum]
IFVGYDEHSKAFRFFVIEPNESVSINTIIESRDAIFDENRLSSVPRPSLSIPKGTKDIGGSVVPEKVTKEDVAFWKEAINDGMDSITGNNTWVLAVLPPGIYYFDTYAPIERISTIKLLLAMTSIHNLIIHQMDVKIAFLNVELDEEMDVKIAFLNVELDEEVYMNHPQGFTMPGNENKMSDKCVYSKFDESGKGVIICLYVNDMLIIGTDQVQVDLIKEFLSSRFSMKDMGEADVILDIRIKHESNRIAISQSFYFEKVLKKFNYFDCTPVSIPMDTSEKLMPNNGHVVSQLEYTSNPGTQHWQAIQRVLKYLKKTMDYRLTYTVYPSVLDKQYKSRVFKNWIWTLALATFMNWIWTPGLYSVKSF